MRKMFLALFFLATSLTAGASLAEDKPADLTPAQQAEARLTLETARNLISYGETKNDALALVVGAKLLASRSFFPRMCTNETELETLALPYRFW